MANFLKNATYQIGTGKNCTSKLKPTTKTPITCIIMLQGHWAQKPRKNSWDMHGITCRKLI